MKKIFVTGANGYIGQRLILELREQDVSIKVLSRVQHPELETVVCDLQKDDIPDSALNGVDTVFHLAGLAHDLRDASGLEWLYLKVNVDATVRLAELAVCADVKKFVFVSSVKAGGHTEKEGAPEGIYGKTKRDAELQLLDVAKNSRMHVAILRPALVYGPSMKGNLGLMCLWIERGWFPPLPEIGNRRSMVHVDDLVRALLFVAADSRTNRRVWIVTDGHPYSSREIYEALCNFVNRSPRLWSVPKFIFDFIGRLNPSIRYKINKLMGNDYYSSDRLEALGFKAKKRLMDLSSSDSAMG